jgi:hypothetical protein
MGILSKVKLRLEELKKAPDRLALLLVAFFFVIRLLGITNPPTDGHAWRQSLTNMITRNLLEVEYNPLYPRIDMAGNKTGITGTEFPVYNMMSSVLCMLFGYTHWYGRLISLIAASAGCWAFYKTVKQAVNTRVAVYALLILSVSIWFNYGRKAFPDTFSMAFMLMGIYLLQQYFVRKQWVWAFGFLITGLIAGLSKMPSVYLFPVIALFTWLEWRKGNKKEALVASLFMGLITIAVGAWYFIWVPYLVETYKYQHYFPVSLMQGIKDAGEHLMGEFERYSFHSMQSFIAFAAFVAGLVLLLKKGSWLAVTSFGLSTVVFVLYTFKTGIVFPTHNYYIIPYVPVMALVAAYGLSFIRSEKWVLLILLAITIEAIGNAQHDFFVKKEHRYRTGVEAVMDKHIPMNSLIVMNGTPNPEMIYFAHRKGWTVDSKDLNNNPGYIAWFRQNGAEFVVIDKYFGDPAVGPIPYFEDEHLKIYKLE